MDRSLRDALESSLGRRYGRPIELTPDQRTAMDELRADLARPVPMLRLLQGDVGSGKTAVAAYALAAAARAGLQAALLAPTDLLARQHAATVGDLLAGERLWFKGAVTNVRTATKDELEHGHVHGDIGVHPH